MIEAFLLLRGGEIVRRAGKRRALPPGIFFQGSRAADSARVSGGPSLACGGDRASRLPVPDGLLRDSYRPTVFLVAITQPPRPGQPVAAWRNLAFPEKERSFLRDGGDPNGERLPVLREVDAAAAPVAPSPAGVTTTNRSSLTMLKHPGVLPAGFTLVAVMPDRGRETTGFSGSTALARWHVLLPSRTGYDAKVTAVHKGKADGPEVRTSIPWPSGTPGA